MLAKPAAMSDAALFTHGTTAVLSTTDASALSRVLAMVIHRQNNQELAARKLTQWSAMLAAMSYSQTRALFAEQHRLQSQLVAGRAALQALRTHVERQDDDIASLQTRQRATEDDLLRVQRELQGKLAAHETALAGQAMQIRRLTKDKLKRAMVVDSVIVAVAALAAQSSLVSLPISVVTLPLGRGRFRATVHSSLHFAAFASLAVALRRQAAGVGLVPEHAALAEYARALFSANGEPAL